MKINFVIAATVFNLAISSIAYVNAHNHLQPKEEKAYLASKGLFDDHDVKDRSLSDWSGNWQSVYGYLQKGDLDIVLESKANNDLSKTVEEYKAYYTQGYKTDVQQIIINNNRIEYHKNDASTSCEYQYSGYKILTYTSGKKGVRYLFTCQNAKSHAPKYIQFSDHIIEPTKSNHFHIYMGNESHEKLLEEMKNWPTYFPLSFSKDDIIHDMLHH